jgi:signal transduction histidine kinase
MSRGDAWWAPAAIVAAVVGLLGTLAAPGGAARFEVAALAAVTVAGFLVRAAWPRMPTVVLVAWTFTPAIVLNLRERGESTMFLLIVALCFLVLETADHRIRIVAGVAAVLAPAAIQAVSPQDWGWGFWMMGTAFGWLSSEQMRRFHTLLTELAATRERLAEQAVHLERRRIAAELHDLVGHSLTVVLLSVTGARRLVRDDPDAATQALLEAERVGRESLAQIRGSVRALRDDRTAGPEAAPMPAATDLPELVETMTAAGSSVDLTVTGKLEHVEAAAGLVVYRVVQESLNNVARHAPGMPARVTVDVADDAVEVEVFDAGPAGAAPAANGSAGVGIVGMRERVEAVGGALDAGPTADGWRVRARIPRTGAGTPA